MQNKKPLFIPGRCAPNELLYPGDHKDDWVCDCKPGKFLKLKIQKNKTYISFFVYLQAICIIHSKIDVSVRSVKDLVWTTIT